MPRHIIILAAVTALGACSGLQSESVELPHGYIHTQVSDDRNMTVSRINYLFNSDGEYVDGSAYSGAHPAVAVTKSVISAGGMVGAARALRPSETYMEGASAEGGAGGAGGAGGSSQASSEATSAASSQSSSSNTNINVNTASGGGDFCPPGQPAPHC